MHIVPRNQSKNKIDNLNNVELFKQDSSIQRFRGIQNSNRKSNSEHNYNINNNQSLNKMNNNNSSYNITYTNIHPPKFKSNEEVQQGQNTEDFKIFNVKEKSIHLTHLTSKSILSTQTNTNQFNVNPETTN